MNLGPDSDFAVLSYAVIACLLPCLGCFIWGLAGFVWGMAISVSFLVMMTLGAAAGAIASSLGRRLLRARGCDVPGYLEFPGFFLPFEVKRAVSHPAEYLAIVNAVNGHRPSARVLLRETAHMRLTACGLADKEFLQIAYRSDRLHEVFEEALSLLRDYSSESVMQFAHHPSGVLRGFELLRTGVAYEYAETMP